MSTKLIKSFDIEIEKCFESDFYFSKSLLIKSNKHPKKILNLVKTEYITCFDGCGRYSLIKIYLFNDSYIIYIKEKANHSHYSSVFTEKHFRLFSFDINDLQTFEFKERILKL